MRIRSIGTKINLIVIGILVVVSAAIAYVAIEQMGSGIKTFATAKAKSDLELVSRYLDSKYPGAWRIRGDQLTKGDTVMNGNFEIVDEIGQLTEDTVTIFQGDTRVSTNVMAEGERAVGTKVSDKVADVVLKGGGSYYGEAVVVGQTYQAAYQPIKSDNGEVIGILYVGAPQRLMDTIRGTFIRQFAVVFAAALAISIVVILMYMRGMKNGLAGWPWRWRKPVPAILRRPSATIHGTRSGCSAPATIRWAPICGSWFSRACSPRTR